MVKNRLAELQNNSGITPGQENGSRQEAKKGNTGSHAKSSKSIQPLKIDMNDSTADFFTAFDEKVVENIEKVRKNVVTIDSLHKKIQISVRVDEKESAESRLSDLVAENKRLSKIIQTTLKAEQAKVEERLKVKSKQSLDSRQEIELRMRQTQINSQSRRFYDIWNAYNATQANYRDKTKEALVRRCKIANSSLNDEQIEEMLDEGKTDVFNECILSQMKSAQQQLTELQDRHDEFIKLEKSIREVHEMFMEISNLINQQGELVDSIEHSTQNAMGRVDDAKKQLMAAEKHKHSARRKKIICFTILVLLAIIIVLVILGELGLFSAKSG